MARDITSGFQTEIEADVLRPIMMVHGEFDSGDLRFWSGYGELDWNGDIFTGSGDLLKMNSVGETQSLTANNVTFELSGLPTSIVAIALGENYQGRRITAYFAVLDENFALIADPYVVFSGFMDVMTISDSGDEATITINCESDLIILKESRERRYTPEDQKQDYPNDKGLDFVPIIQDIELTFGAGRTD